MTDLNFIAWLKGVLLSTEIDLYILHQINGIKYSNGAEVKIRDEAPRRMSALKRDQGMIIFPEKSKIEIKNSILEAATSALGDGEYTPAGLGNYLIIIDRLGSIHDEEQYELTKVVCEMIPKDTYITMLELLIDQFRSNYSFSSNESDNLSIEEWEKLSASLQYIDRFQNPIDIIRRCLRFRMEELPLLQLVSQMNANTKVALFEYGLSLDSLTEDQLITHLSSEPEEIPFYAFQILDKFTAPPVFLGEHLSNFLVGVHWESSGRHLFQRLYGNSRKRINEDTKKILAKSVDLYLIGSLFSGRDAQTILKTFSWPDDYYSLGGWVAKFSQVENESKVKYDATFIEALVSEFSEQLAQLKSNLPSYIDGTKNSYHMWFTDVFDVKAQYASGFIMFSIFKCSSDKYEVCEKNLRKLCYEIKELYYGSFDANHLALKSSNFLLALILSYPTNENTDRLVPLLRLFIDILGHPWIVYSERSEIIWGKDTGNYLNPELYFVLRRLQEVPENYKEPVHEFKKEIAATSTFDWPM